MSRNCDVLHQEYVCRLNNTTKTEKRTLPGSVHKAYDFW